MKKTAKFLAGLAVAVLCVSTARAVWDSTLGNAPDSYKLCFGSGANSCVSGSTVGNYVNLLVGGNTVLNTNASGVAVTGTLNVTGASTFSTVLSSFTSANPAGSISATALNACIAGSTVSLTLPAQTSTVWVGFSGASTTSVLGSTVTVGILIDGAYATVAGVTETSALGLKTVGQWATVGGDDLNMSFPSVPITVTAGASHNFCLTMKSTSGTAYIDNNASIAVFEAHFLP